MPSHLPALERETLLRPLLDHLASTDCAEDNTWRDWRITPIPGGRNNLLRRAKGPRADLAVKFCVRDDCDRAGREYGALSALRQAGLSIAPQPVFVDRDTYAQPVVVQSWLDGKVKALSPTTSAEWHKLLEHLALVHTITPDRVDLELLKSRIHATSAEDGRQIVKQQLAHIPQSARDRSLQAILAQFEQIQFPEWPEPPTTLCRLDNNITNYIQRSGPWASVDWEYSGWGDPGFDVANLLTHVAYMDSPSSQWMSLATAYCGLAQEASAIVRIQTYCQILVVWWVIRLARYLYELPRGLDSRLVDWPAGWQEDIEAKYQHYLVLAKTLYAEHPSTQLRT